MMNRNSTSLPAALDVPREENSKHTHISVGSDNKRAIRAAYGIGHKMAPGAIPAGLLARRRRALAGSDRNLSAPVIKKLSDPRRRRARLGALALVTLIKLLLALKSSDKTLIQALQITNFRVPSFVPSNLPTKPPSGGQPYNAAPADLAKPILFDCDYDYDPKEDTRLTVKWFKNKEAEPFYQWLSELKVRSFADWIRPLVNETFVSDPLDPFKRFRSLLISRISMNLTGHYTCLVSSLKDQDMRQSTLVVYKPPRNFTFEHRIYPAPASFLSSPLPAAQPAASQRYESTVLKQQDHQQPAARNSPYQPSPTVFSNHESAAGLVGQVPFVRQPAASPTQFKGLPGPGSPGAVPYQWPPPMSVWPPSEDGARRPQANNQPAPAAAIIVRPPNNNSQNQSLPQTTSAASAATDSPTKIVYTHDGRPIKRPRLRRQLDSRIDQRQLEAAQQQYQQQRAAQISSWQLRKKLGELQAAAPNHTSYHAQLQQQQQQQPYYPASQAYSPSAPNQNYAIQLHHFQCQATQVTPRPVLVLTVKRGADSIAQYLHESSIVSIRPYQVTQEELFAAPNASATSYQPLRPGARQFGANAAAARPSDGDEQEDDARAPAPFLVTLYDITVSATVALNVSLSNYSQQPLPALSAAAPRLLSQAGELEPQYQQPIGINTILAFRRGQRMSFECHLELTGTEFEQRQRININEEEVYRFAEAEERARLLRLQQVREGQARLQQLQQQQQHEGRQQAADSSTGLLMGFGSSSSAAPSPPLSQLERPRYLLGLALVLAAALSLRSPRSRLSRSADTLDN